MLQPDPDPSTYGPACPTCWQPVTLALAGEVAGPFTAPIGHVVLRDDTTGMFTFLHCPDLPRGSTG